MLGTKYFRLLNDLSSAAVAEEIGISQRLLGRLENDIELNHSTAHYLALCKIYGVSIEQIIMEYPDIPKKNATKAASRAQTPMGNYLRNNYHTTRTLAKELGVSRQTVSTICYAEKPPVKYIEKLAEIEGISVAEFEIKYGKGA